MIKLINESIENNQFKFPLDTWFYKYEAEIDKLIDENDPLLNKYCIISVGGNQYAAGITGVNRWQHAYIDKNTQQGYRLKKDARDAARRADIISYRKKGRGDEGYGDVGSEWNKVSIMTMREFFELYNNSWSSRGAQVPSYFEGI
jgi:hypothetical protein